MKILIIENTVEHMQAFCSTFDTLPLVQFVHRAYNYQDAMDKLNNNSYDVALVDIDLKDTHNGIDICHTIRRNSPDTIVLLITGYNSPQLLKDAYDAGCYDYILKPWNRTELRLKVLRWAELMTCKQSQKKQLVYQGLAFDFKRSTFHFNGQALQLSKSCKLLLLLLLKSPELVVSKQEIQRQLWGDHDTSIKKRNIGERVGALKKQLPVEIAGWIVAVFGDGYILRKHSVRDNYEY